MQHINNAFSSYFIVIYDGVLYFLEEMFFLEIFLKTKYLCIALGMWECSSVVEHSTADREVGGSIPLPLFFITIRYLSKDVRRLKDLFSSIFSTTKALEYCFFVVLHFNL